MAVDPNTMTPQEYLEHLNAESARRQREQAARMLGDRARETASTGQAPHHQQSASPGRPMPQARSSIDDRTPPGQGLGERLASPKRWLAASVWALLAVGATVLWPGAGQLITGQLLSALALFIFHDDITGFLATNGELQQALGQDGETLTRWFTWLLMAYAALGAFRMSFKPEPTPEGKGSAG